MPRTAASIDWNTNTAWRQPRCEPAAAGVYGHGALATEIGGTLSHGAVVARELGLPAVVDLPDATRIFTTGQRVRLNADAGTLEALD
ncbi:Phosphoenolpyruvate synthase [Enhygromyxa salina]|uniref:Phosphoenolpyruvate synthase n=1 Tax=Enhygromyxa salina TaxID=215803 RepID=A0A0C2DDP1_9BACT|nr:PEP-utilizing enzyme [Enhygromyxa salina]KIG17757.1 Phosphoenolpyruvate synthase [Enhygromyxa salina]